MFAMYYIYGVSVPSLLIESTDSMMQESNIIASQLLTIYMKIPLLLPTNTNLLHGQENVWKIPMLLPVSVLHADKTVFTEKLGVVRGKGELTKEQVALIQSATLDAY